MEVSYKPVSRILFPSINSGRYHLSAHRIAAVMYLPTHPETSSDEVNEQLTLLY